MLPKTFLLKHLVHSKNIRKKDKLHILNLNKNMAEQLVVVTRGNLVESIHRGDIAIVDFKGNLHYQVGNPQKVTYMRSCAKPFQALPLVCSGAASAFGFGAAELSIACASHYAEPQHLKTVQGMLAKLHLAPEHILGGTATSLNPDYALELAWNHTKLNPIYSDCSGKHAGMLAACLHQNYPIESYMELQHPLQQQILDDVATFCQYEKSAIAIGIDGCSVPVHALPLYNIALGYAQLANPAQLHSSYQEAATILYDAMVAQPEMLSGTGGFCTALTQVAKGKLIGKIGAEGVYCVAIRDLGMGIAIKMEAGNMSMLAPAVMECLKQLDVLSDEEFKQLSHFYIKENSNDLGTAVGKVKADFELESMH